jgi:hypothetical protein
LRRIVPAQVDNGFDPELIPIRGNAADTGLIASIHRTRELETIGIERTQKTVINKPKIEVGNQSLPWGEGFRGRGNIPAFN